MNTIVSTETSRPWFKQPWLWFVLSIPITSVILSSIMVTVAIVGRDTLVSDNYYKDGMAINQTLEQDHLANKLGLKPLLTIDGTVIKLELKALGKIADQPFLTFKLLHPTSAEKDMIIKLLPSGNGLYLGELPHIAEGRFYLDLYAFDNSWRLREEVNTPVENYKLNSGT